MKMDTNSNPMSDAEFLEGLERCTLHPSDFTHEAHLRLAWIQIRMFGLETAKMNIEKLLRTYVEHVGAKDKYHQTLTLAAVECVHHFLNKSRSDSFSDFILEFPQLLNNFKALINSHYSFDIFESAEARKDYVEPDVIPFA